MLQKVISDAKIEIQRKLESVPVGSTIYLTKTNLRFGRKGMRNLNNFEGHLQEGC